MREEATWNSMETPRETPRCSAPWRLPGCCDLTPCHCGRRRQPGARRELRIPAIRLEAPVEDRVLCAGVADPHGPVALILPLDDLEDVSVPRQHLRPLAAVAGRGGDIDVGQVRDRTVGQHARPAEYGHDPQRVVDVPLDAEVDVDTVPVLHEAQLASVAVAVAVDVVPEPEARLQRLHVVRPDQHVARVGARRVLPRRRPRGLVAQRDRKSTRLNSSHGYISYAVFCLKKKKKTPTRPTASHVND